MRDPERTTEEASGPLPGTQDICFETVVAGMLDPVVATDGSGTVVFANDSCTTVLGYAPEELVGRNVKMLMPEPYHSEHDAYLERYRATGVTGILGVRRELPVLRADGRVIECELSIARIDLPDGGEPVFCGSFRDVTDRKEAARALAASERRFRAIFDGEFQFVGLLDVGGGILEINQTALRSTGVERDEVVGRPFWEGPWWSRSQGDRDRIQEAVEQARKGEFVRFEIEVATRRGERLRVDFSLKPIRDEDGRVVLLIPEGRDVTERERVRRREQAMMRAFADIGESASLLAHEIKNPITSVNLALRAVAKQLREDEKKVLTELVERMQKLERLMRRTLSLTRPLDLEVAEIDPRELLSGAARQLAPELEETRVELEVEPPETVPPLFGDRHLLEEVLVNLIRNAVDAIGPGGGRVRLAARAAEGQLAIAVDDDGPGIPESLVATLFKPFVTTKESGTGLGLSIARKVVEAHGGTIEASNGPLGGARFELRLPLG